jgi:vancomycin permeability regulator SanA
LRRLKSFSKTALIFIVVFLLLDIIAVILYWNYSISFIKYNYNRNFDCGIVFFHSVKKTGGLSEDSKQRCNVSIDLFKTGKIRYILCSGGASASSDKIGSRLLKEYMLNSGIPDSLVLTDTLSYSSKTNIFESEKILKEKNFKSAILISSPSHIPRIIHLSKDYNFEKEYLTFGGDYSIFEILKDCNSEFVKWVYLLFLPDIFAEYSKQILRNCDFCP